MNGEGDNILQLNLTAETLVFSNGHDIGVVPNRGLGSQSDIDLRGVSYLQSVSDITNPSKFGEPREGIHLEPGMFLHVPETKINPIAPGSYVRMATVPHGTTILAQTVSTLTATGPPKFPETNTRPFIIGKKPPFKKNEFFTFDSQTATNFPTHRLPQNLTEIKGETITQEMLNNPNIVLENANKDKTIKDTITMFSLREKRVVLPTSTFS
jgi:hypothetical protein